MPKEFTGVINDSARSFASRLGSRLVFETVHARDAIMAACCGNGLFAYWYRDIKDARFITYDEIELLKSVEIGTASWIGFGAIFLPGVVLGKGCIVGAGAVVTKSFPDGSIVAGNPATNIGMRDMEHFSSHLDNGHTYLKNKVFHKLKKVESVVNVQKHSSAKQ